MSAEEILYEHIPPTPLSCLPVLDFIFFYSALVNKYCHVENLCVPVFPLLRSYYYFFGDFELMMTYDLLQQVFFLTGTCGERACTASWGVTRRSFPWKCRAGPAKLLNCRWRQPQDLQAVDDWKKKKIKWMRVLPFIEEGAAQAVNSPQNPPTPTPTRLLRLEENPLISCVSIDFFFFFF